MTVSAIVSYYYEQTCGGWRERWFSLTEGVAVGTTQSQVNMRRTPPQTEIIQAVSYSTAISTIEVLPAVTEQEAWLLLAQSVFAKGWDNPQDARYNAL